jgi:hypothetical protein
MGEARKLDVEGLLTALVQHSIDFILIGGIAAQLLNLPVPATIDVDIAPLRSKKNLERLSEFFEDVHAALLTADEDGTWFPRTPVENWAQYSTLHLITDFGLLDLVFEPEGTTSGYHDLLNGSTLTQVGHSDVRCISVEQWVELKSSAGRPKDVEHLSMYFSEKKKRERS